MSVAVRDLTTAQEVFANRARVKNYFANLKPSIDQRRVDGLKSEMEAIKAERDNFRAQRDEIRDKYSALLAKITAGASPEITAEISMPAEKAVTHFTGTVSINRIFDAVCTFYHVKKSDLISERRTAYVLRPRHVGMYLMRALTTNSLPSIGRYFGGRDHTTVFHAIQSMEEKRKTDEKLDAEIKALTARILVG